MSQSGHAIEHPNLPERHGVSETVVTQRRGARWSTGRRLSTAGPAQSPKADPARQCWPLAAASLRERLDQYTGKRREREDYNLVEVIGGSQPMTVEDYVAATRDEFNHDGRSALRDALLPA